MSEVDRELMGRAERLHGRVSRMLYWSTRSSRRTPAVPDSLTRTHACDRKFPRTDPGNVPGNVSISPPRHAGS
eukprot:557684-Prymnesium_polylepis.2